MKQNYIYSVLLACVFACGSTQAQITATNYGPVVDYTNAIIDCMNAQGEELGDRSQFYYGLQDKYMDGVKDANVYVNRIGFDMAGSPIPEKCVEKTPPAVMGAKDVAFFNTQYAALQENFVKCMMIYNDIVTHVDRSSYVNYALPEGKAKVQELLAAYEKYYANKNALSKRIDELQELTFGFSVAKSPHKIQYTNMYKDLKEVDKIAEMIGSYDDIKNKKTEIITALSALEPKLIEHVLQGPKSGERLNSYYHQYYDHVFSYLKITWELANGQFGDYYLERKLKDYSYHLGNITESYNSAIDSE